MHVPLSTLEEHSIDCAMVYFWRGHVIGLELDSPLQTEPLEAESRPGAVQPQPLVCLVGVVGCGLSKGGECSSVIL